MKDFDSIVDDTMAHVAYSYYCYYSFDYNMKRVVVAVVAQID